MALLARHLPSLLIQSAQRELDRYLALDRAHESPSEVSLHEYFPVFVLDVTALTDESASDNSWGRYSLTTGRWHVQVHADGRPVGYARVLARETPRVVGYTRTDIAADIDRAIDVVDSAELSDKLYASIVEIASLRIAALVLAPQGHFDSSTSYAVVYELPIQPVSIEKFVLYPVSELMPQLRRTLQQMSATAKARRTMTGADPAGQAAMPE